MIALVKASSFTLKTIIDNTDKLITELEAAGYEAYYVGGCVRDHLMDRTTSDIDVTTSATPDEIKRVFAGCRVLETGIRHGTLTVFTEQIAGRFETADMASHPKGLPVEVTTFRTESGYSDSRHPDSVFFVQNLKEDLGRRDFTINAMAMDVSGNIIDIYGGRADLKARLIRCVGDPDARFNEDALRIMRAMRFAAVLDDGAAGGAGFAADSAGFAVEPETEAAMFRNKELLKNISAERIFAELRKLVVGPHAGIVIRRYVDIIGVVIPELLALKGFAQHNPYHRYDVLEHCVRTLEMCHDSAPVALAALLHDVGKPNTFSLDGEGVGHMYGHPAEGEVIARNIMQRLKADNDTASHVCTLVKHHDLVFQKDKKLLKRWMNRYTPEILLEILQIKRADNFATGNMSGDLAQKFNEIEGMIHEILDAGEPFGLKDLAIDGNDLLALYGNCSGLLHSGGRRAAITAGPWIGKTLDQLLDDVIDGKVENKKETLLDRAKELLNAGG